MFNSKLQVDRRAVAALVLCFLVSLPAVTPRVSASDEIEYFAFLRSLWFDHDLSFDNEYRHFYEQGRAQSSGFRETFLERTTETGLRVNFATIGCAMAWAPFYAAADLSVRAANRAGFAIPADGYSAPYITAVCLGSAVYGLLALILALRIVRQVGQPAANGSGSWVAQAGPAVIVWAGTPLFFYMYLAPAFSHAVSAFAVAAFVATWLVVRRKWSAGGVAGLGALAAFMAMVREQDLFFVIGPAIDGAWTALSRLRARRHNESVPERAHVLRTVLVAAATFAVVYAPQAIAYLTLNGRVFPSRLVTRKMNWAAPHALQVLGSPEHGLFIWTPLAVLALAGLVVLAWRAGDTRRLAVCLLLMVAAQVYVAGSVESWTVAGAFGQRRFVGLTVLLVVGLAALADAVRLKAGRAVLLGSVLVCVWWNIGLTIQFGAGLMDRQRLEPARNAYTTFVTLPRTLPSLAYRFLFDRASFYEGSRTESP